MEREVGGGIGMGNTCKPMAVSFQCMIKSTTIKIIIIIKNKINKSSLNIWKFTVHVLLKPGLENFEHYFTSM